MNVRSSKEHYLRVVLFSGAFREWNIAFKYSSSEMGYIVIHNNLHFGIPLIVNGSLPLWVAGFRASFFIICSGTITSAKPLYQLLCRDICHSKKRGNSAVSILVCSLVTKLCLTLCNPINCSPPGSSVHGIFRQEKWVATSSSRGPYRLGSSLCLLHCRWLLYHWAAREAPHFGWPVLPFSQVQEQM